MRLIAAVLLVVGAGASGSVPAASADNAQCPSDRICTWLLPNFTGDRKVFPPSPDLQGLGEHAELVDSWANNTSSSWALVERVEGGTPIILDCLAPGASHATLNDVVTLFADGLLKLPVGCPL